MHIIYVMYVTYIQDVKYYLAVKHEQEMLHGHRLFWLGPQNHDYSKI